MKKNLPIILSICALVVAVAAVVLPFVMPSCGTKAASDEAVEAAVAKSIAFFNLDQVLSRYDMAIKLQADFEKKAQSIDQDLTRRRTKLENEDKELTDKLNKGLMTRSTAELKYNDLQKKVASFQQYGQQKQQELAEEQQVMINNIANSVSEYVKKFNEVKGYDVIFSTQGDLLSSPVVAGDSALDITEELIAGLNEDYKASK